MANRTDTTRAIKKTLQRAMEREFGCCSRFKIQVKENFSWNDSKTISFVVNMVKDDKRSPWPETR